MQTLLLYAINVSVLEEKKRTTKFKKYVSCFFWKIKTKSHLKHLHITGGGKNVDDVTCVNVQIRRISVLKKRSKATHGDVLKFDSHVTTIGSVRNRNWSGWFSSANCGQEVVATCGHYRFVSLREKQNYKKCHRIQFHKNISMSQNQNLWTKTERGTP